MGKIQNICPLHFANYKVRFTQNQDNDVTSEQEQERIIIETHKRAHRNHKENKAQILEENYFRKMTKKIKDVVSYCSVCKKNKYDRHPIKPELQKTPIQKTPLFISISTTRKENIYLQLSTNFQSMRR